jgi:hypothetical protein
MNETFFESKEEKEEREKFMKEKLEIVLAKKARAEYDSMTKFKSYINPNASFIQK